MMPNPPSNLLFDECFRAEDDRFLELLMQFESYTFLRSFAGRWVKDDRPWSRSQMVGYLHSNLNLPGHEVLVKRLFKHYEAEQDWEILPHFLVAFDRLVRRKRTMRYRCDDQSDRYWREEALYAKPNKTVINESGRTAEYVYMGITRTYPLPNIVNRPENKLFSNRTRNHLRRRVWRGFRHLAYRDPQTYLASITMALPQYVDADFEHGENILDNWSLMHACFFHHEAIDITALHVNLAQGRGLAELSAKPYRPDLWETKDAASHLVRLILSANSSFVRQWAIELIQSIGKEALAEIDVSDLIAMLGHTDTRVHEFAMELFQSHSGLANMRVDRWLALLDEASPGVLATICDAMKLHVTPDRLDSQELIRLSCAEPVPVASTGFELLRARHETRAYPSAELVALASAQCAAVAGEMTSWALGVISSANAFDANQVIEFFDAMQEETRRAALDWLESEQSPGYGDASLWSRLIESPFDDVKIRLVESLAKRSRQTHLPEHDISPIWSAVILGVHRGGRTKLKAVEQVASVISEDLDAADRLLPVLAVAVRSIRGPERRRALSEVVRLAVGNVALKEKLSQHLPELQWMAPASEEAV